MKIKRLSAALLAAMMLALALVPAHIALATEKPAARYATPAGYNENDYQKLVAFLEIADENGVKNGNKISPVYDPADPTTWLDPNSMDEITYWADREEKRISIMRWEDRNLAGDLDVSGCSALQVLYCCSGGITSIDVTGCEELYDFDCHANMISELDVSTNENLTYFNCSGNRIASLNVSANPRLERLFCGTNLLTELDVSENRGLSLLECAFNGLTSLDVSTCGALEQLICSGNGLTGLDVSHNPNLRWLTCSGNKFAELDLSANPQVQFNTIRAEGGGYVGTYAGFGSGFTTVHTAVAEAMPGATFLGWYSDEGYLVSPAAELSSAVGYANVTARFTEAPALPGDVDGSGSVTANDALLVLRAALGLIDGIDASVADVDGTGTVTANDALMILRCALGISEL